MVLNFQDNVNIFDLLERFFATGASDLWLFMGLVLIWFDLTVVICDLMDKWNSLKHYPILSLIIYLLSFAQKKFLHEIEKMVLWWRVCSGFYVGVRCGGGGCWCYWRFILIMDSQSLPDDIFCPGFFGLWWFVQA